MQKKIKVLYIHHHGTVGGASRSLMYLIKNFPEGTVDPIILTPRGSATSSFRTVTENVFEIKELPEITSIAGGKNYFLRLAKTLLTIKNVWYVKKWIDKVKPDIIHLNDLSLVIIAALCKKMNYKVVMHARVVLSDRVGFLNWIIRSMMKTYVDKVICIDGSVKNKLKGVKNTQIVYNPLHVNPTLAELKESSKAGGNCNVLFLANLLRYKGLFDLLKAAKELKNEDHIKIYIAGSNSRPKEYFSTLQGKVLNYLGIVEDTETEVLKIIKDQELTNVTFLGHVKNISEWLKKTDILVFPSHMNGPSRSVFEAGAMGIPSIVALKDKVEDVVTHYENGIIIPEKSYKILAQEIKALSDDHELRSRLGKNAHKHFNELNNPLSSSKAVLDIYRTL